MRTWGLRDRGPGPWGAANRKDGARADARNAPSNCLNCRGTSSAIQSNPESRVSIISPCVASLVTVLRSSGPVHDRASPRAVLRDRRRRLDGETIPAQRLGGPPLRRDVFVPAPRPGGGPAALFTAGPALDARRAPVRRGGRPAARHRAHGLRLPPEVRARQRPGGGRRRTLRIAAPA